MVTAGNLFPTQTVKVHPELSCLPQVNLYTRPTALHLLQDHANGETNNDMLSEWAESIRGLTNRSKSKAGLATQAERKFSRQNSASR